MKPSRPRILVAPLDWGLGHATRCIPIIRALLARGCNVFIAGSGPHTDLLLREFPDCVALPIVNYSITYAQSPLLLAMKFPAMLARVYACARAERRQLAAIIAQRRIDAVISDQRFGCWSRRVPSIYITHQLCLKMPRGFSWLEPVFAAGLRSAANRFSEVWIPDLAGDGNLTGDLTRKYPLPPRHRFIGPLSRFSGLAAEITDEQGPNLLVMLSGPEPQRSILERRILEQARMFPESVAVLPGRSARAEDCGNPANVQIIAGASTVRIYALMRAARAIICRGGYSTIMELASMGRTAALIPTPGQSEQEYLCAHLAAQGRFLVRQQASFDLHETYAALTALSDPAPLREDAQALQRAIETIISTPLP